MTEMVEFLFDFGSPNAYLVHKVIPALEARLGGSVSYTPILLGGLFKLAGNRPPIVAFADSPAKLAYEKREMHRFIKLHGLDAFRWNPHFPVNTLQLMRGVLAADELGVREAYIDAVFAAMWEKQRKLDGMEVIVETLTEAGLPAEAITARALQPAIKDALSAATAAAHARGAFGSPTFFVGEEMFFGKERLAAVEAEALRNAA